MYQPIFQRRFNPNNSTKINLSENSSLVKSGISSQEELGEIIKNYLSSKKVKFGYGGYLEKRNIYEGYKNFGKERNIHLGMDVWCLNQEEISCPFDGEVAVSHVHDSEGEYGGLIIIKHDMGGDFYHTLYGHLSHKSVKSNPVGKRLRAGEVFAQLGSSKENGNWPIHLHFQVIEQDEIEGNNYPGVCSQENLSSYKRKCPDPRKWLNL